MQYFHANLYKLISVNVKVKCVHTIYVLYVCMYNLPCIETEIFCIVEDYGGTVVLFYCQTTVWNSVSTNFMLHVWITYVIKYRKYKFSVSQYYALSLPTLARHRKIIKNNSFVLAGNLNANA